MVLLNKNRLLYYKQKVPGSGVVQRQIVGNWVFQGSLKTLGLGRTGNTKRYQELMFIFDQLKSRKKDYCFLFK